MMKKKLFLLSILTLFLFSACVSDKEEIIEGFGFKIETELYDFGTIDEGQIVDYQFKVKNIGTETISIIDVKPTCGCTVAETWDKEILTGETGSIPVSFNSQGFQGEVTKTIRVTTNIPGNEDLNLSLKGKISVPIEVDPRLLWMGEVIDTKATLTGTVKITNNTEESMDIKEIIPANPNTEIKILNQEQGKIFTIEVSIKPPFKEGNISENIKLKTNLTDKEEIQINYSYYLPEPIRVYPREIHFYPDHLKNGLSRTITIQSRLDIPIKLKNVTLSNPELTYKEEMTTPNKITRLVLTIPSGFEIPEGTEPFISFKIENDPSNQEYKVPLKLIP